MHQSTTTTIVLADDHPVVCAGLRMIFENSSEFTVVAEAGNSRETFEFYRRYRPRVLLLDVQMPGEGGLRVAARILAHDREARILFLSAHTSPPVIAQAIKAGVHGFIGKQSAPAAILAAARRVAAGERFIDPLLYPAERGRPEFGLGDLDGLTRREFEVFEKLSAGESLEEIADRLSISPKTAAIHKSSVLRKLGLRNAVELAHLAISEGVVELWHHSRYGKQN